MIGRRPIAPLELITREVLGEGDWALRFELVNNPDSPEGGPLQRTAYNVCAPLGATVEFDACQTLALQDAVDNVEPEVTAAKYSELTGETVKPTTLTTHVHRSVRRLTSSLTTSEAACKAIVLGKIGAGPEAPIEEALDGSHLAVLAAKGVGYTYKEMRFLPWGVYNARRQVRSARKFLGVPLFANYPHVMARVFAAGAFIIGEPYDPRDLS